LKNKHLLAALIGAASFLLYSNTIPNFLNIDDELIYDNRILSDYGFSALQKIFTEPYYKDAAGNVYEYRPMVLVSFLMEFMLFGKNPHVSHAVNVIIFSGTCVLLFYLLLTLLRNYENALRISLLASLLFATHTIHTEAVASIKNRDEVLSLLFAVAGWLFALRFVDSKKAVAYIFFLIFFTAGLFSKQTSITFGILIPVSIILFREVTVRQLWLLILPMTLINTFFSPVYLLYKKVLLFAGQMIFLLMFYYAMAQRQELIAFFTSLLRKIKVFPAEILSQIKNKGAAGIQRKNTFTRYGINIRVSVGLLIMVVAMIATGILLSGRGDKTRFDIKDMLHDFRELWVTPALQKPAPAVVPIAGRKLNFVEVPLLFVNSTNVKTATSIYVMGQYLRLMFIPHPLGFYYGYGQIPLYDFSQIKVWACLLVYISLFSLMIYLLVRKRHLIGAFGILFFLVSVFPLSNLITPIAGIMAERLAYTPSLGYCIALSYLLTYPALERCSKMLMWNRSALLKASNIFFACLVAIYSYATVRRNALWKDSLTLMKSDIEYLQISARANHLFAAHLAYKASRDGRSYLPANQKLLQEAVFHFKKALEIYPEFPFAWFDLAKAYLLLGDTKNAEDAYYHSTRVDSTFAPAWFELGVLLSSTGKGSEAENAYREAIKRDSSLTEAYLNLSYTYFLQGKYSESLEISRTALRHGANPYDIYVNMGRVYIQQQDLQNAVLYLEKAVAINSSDKSLLEMLATLHQRLGNSVKAAYYHQLAISD